MKKNTQKPLISPKFMTKPYLASAGVIAFVLIAGGTAYAANSSRPGDALYSVDAFTERMQSALAFSPQGKANLALGLAAERVTEAQATLLASELKPANLNIALNGLAVQRANVADLVAKEAALKPQAKTFEDKLDGQEANLDATFTEKKRRLNNLVKELKDQLKQAEAAGATDRISRIKTELAALNAQKDTLEAEEDAAVKALDAEEERLEAQLEAEEKVLEAEEEAREAEVERLEEEAEAARENAQEAGEAEQEKLEQVAEQAEVAEDKAREENNQESGGNVKKESSSGEAEKRDTQQSERPEESRR